MKKYRTLGLAFTGLAFIGFIGQLALYYPDLPSKMVSHFDFHGNPDRNLSKVSFFIFYGSLELVSALLFFGIMKWIKICNSKWVNIPNREYWLQDSRKAATLEAIANVMVFFSGATNLLLVGVFQLTFWANLSADHKLNMASLAYLVVAYGFGTFTGLLAMQRKFLRIPR